MKRAIFVITAMSLVGCVTVSVPSSQKEPIASPEHNRSCRQYSPPRRRALPSEPDLNSRTGDYRKDLEETAEKLAIYAGALRDYIDEEHLDEDSALKRHLQECSEK